MQADGGIWMACGSGTKLQTAELQRGIGELPPVDEQALGLQFFEYVLLLHFGSLRHALRQGLRSDARLIGSVYDVAHQEKILGREDGLCGKEVQQWHALRVVGEIGNDVGGLPLLLRQLVLYVEEADGVYLIAEKVDAVRIL